MNSTKEQLARFYGLKMRVDAQEETKKHAEGLLEEAYAELVYVCPHSEAIDWQTTTRQGVYRVCKICGIEDQASEGSTPGDEYDYGYPGHPSEEFWKNSNVETTDNRVYFWSFRRQHGWQVRHGAPWHWRLAPSG